MIPQNRLDIVLKRLAAALDHLEAAAERRAKVDAERNDFEEELAVMQDDRSRLAVELDGALAKAKVLSAANAEVSRRLERASDAIRSVLTAAPGRD
jgi:chromosome segregation ATPase